MGNMSSRKSAQLTHNAELERCAKHIARRDRPPAFSRIPTDAVDLAREELELSDGLRGLSYLVSFKGRNTGYVDLIPWFFNDFEREDFCAAKKLEKLGFEKGKVAEIWRVFPLDKDRELRGKGIGTAVLLRLLGELRSEGFTGVFVLRPFRERLRKLLARNGFLSEDFVRDDGAHDTVWCKKFDNATLASSKQQSLI